MISTTKEFDTAIAITDQALNGEGPRPEDFEIGLMLEVPGVAMNAAAFARRADFMSIGTNHLTQYSLAAERGNDSVAISPILDPGVLQMIERVGVAGGARTRVAVCGELASDPAAMPVLIGLGVDELSVTPLALPGVKDEVRRWAMADARACPRGSRSRLGRCSARDDRNTPRGDLARGIIGTAVGVWRDTP